MVLEFSPCVPPGRLLRRVCRDHQRYSDPQKVTSNGPYKELLAYLGDVRRMRPRDVGLSLGSKANATTRCRNQTWKSFCINKTRRYLSYAPPAYECGTRPFFRWVRSQGRSSDASGNSKNVSGPIGIPLFGALQAPGEKTNPSEEG